MRIASLFFLIALSSLVATTGCKPEEQITVYRIPKAVSGLDGFRDAGADSPNQTAPPTTATQESGQSHSDGSRTLSAHRCRVVF